MASEKQAFSDAKPRRQFLNMLLGEISGAGQNTRHQLLVSEFRKIRHAQTVLLHQQAQHSDIHRNLSGSTTPPTFDELCQALGLTSRD